ncbi:MAG: carboxypeptidase regulatory-like domain-containing protein [Desulfobacterales bacterium]|nr:MAG: carboxypeptidase regulatory-like domain-containing protein [Desulfobacterales bacterium]
MKNYLVKGRFILTCLVLFISIISCSPKYVVRGRVMDAETRQPIKGAAVAIRWYQDNSAQQSSESETLGAAQVLSDDSGVFQIPEYPDKRYVLGVYKNGYICWSSRDIFSIDPQVFDSEKYRKWKHHVLKDGMQIDLRPLRNIHLRDLHAGFTVMVAGETTDIDSGPFHEAIQSEYKLWREKLRKDFQKQLGVQ